jgi:hypothetical protein
MEPISGSLDVRGVGNSSAVSHLVFTIGKKKIKNPSVVNFTLYLDDKETGSIPLYVRKATQ